MGATFTIAPYPFLRDLVAKQGKGRAILIDFRTQNRSQTHGTFKLLFNTLLR